MSDQNASNAASSTAGLDFDRAIPSPAARDTAPADGVTNNDSIGPVAPAAQARVSCSACSRAMTATYHTVNGAPVCGACRLKAQSAGGSVSDSATLAKAALYGAGAAIAGAVIYWAVMEYMNLEIGFVAILTGWMVGRAMSAATAGRGGRLLQVGGAALVYVSVAMAYFAFAVRAAIGASGADAVAGAAESGISVVGLLIMAVVGLATPILVVLESMPGGLISALIIGFGMMQAWKMLEPTPIQVEGPFKVSGAPV
ncbi:MAG: hypothetical protein ACKVS7_11920 [Gemmatimonadaceae bacterium]